MTTLDRRAIALPVPSTWHAEHVAILERLEGFYQLARDTDAQPTPDWLRARMAECEAHDVMPFAETVEWYHVRAGLARRARVPSVYRRFAAAYRENYFATYTDASWIQAAMDTGAYHLAMLLAAQPSARGAGLDRQSFYNQAVDGITKNKEVLMSRVGSWASVVTSADDANAFADALLEHIIGYHHWHDVRHEFTNDFHIALMRFGTSSVAALVRRRNDEFMFRSFREHHRIRWFRDCTHALWYNNETVARALLETHGNIVVPEHATCDAMMPLLVARHEQLIETFSVVILMKIALRSNNHAVFIELDELDVAKRLEASAYIDVATNTVYTLTDELLTALPARHWLVAGLVASLSPSVYARYKQSSFLRRHFTNAICLSTVNCYLSLETAATLFAALDETDAPMSLLASQQLRAARQLFPSQDVMRHHACTNVQAFTATTLLRDVELHIIDWAGALVTEDIAKDRALVLANLWIAAEYPRLLLETHIIEWISAARHIDEDVLMLVLRGTQHAMTNAEVFAWIETIARGRMRLPRRFRETTEDFSAYDGVARLFTD